MPRKIERPCGFCKGKGEVVEGEFIQEKDRCPICRGRGYHMMDSSSRLCGNCGGRGKMGGLLGGGRCRECGGFGWV